MSTESLSIAPLELTLSPTLAQLMDKLIPSDGSIGYRNATLTGDARCAALFAGGNLTIPNNTITFPNDGILLGTGKAESLTTQDSTETSFDFGTPGDDQINTSTLPSFDACSLEFDFKCLTASANSLFIDYMFASDEYIEQVLENDGFIDAFGIFVNDVNIALVPGSNDPVTVYNVNQNVNSEYFVFNDPRPTYAKYLDFEPDGFTNGLNSTVPVVQFGWNRFKMGIVDVGDSNIDSWVFVKGGSGGGFQCFKDDSIPSTCDPDAQGSACGDPHFRTFDAQLFSYHGQCDLVLTRSQSFSDGLGLEVHIRTTRMNGPNAADYSYISGAAVKIGDDILEVNQEGDLVINGTADEGGFDQNKNIIIFSGKFNVSKNTKGVKNRIIIYDLELGNGISIQIRANTKNGMLFVDVNGAFVDSEGLLGAAPAKGSGLVARDGVTDLTGHWNTYGEEWQVNDVDPKLFQDTERHPQFPETCSYTAKDIGKTHFRHRRRLAESDKVGIEAATDACSHLSSEEMREFCIFDIMATGDLDLVEDPFYTSD